MERKRWKVGSWRRWLGRARAWSGRCTGRSKDTGLLRQKVLRVVVQEYQGPVGGVKAAVVAKCEYELRAARAEFDLAAEGTGADRLVKTMEEAARQHRGDQLIRIFAEVRRAQGKEGGGGAP